MTAARPVVETDPRRISTRRAALLIAGALALASATVGGRGRRADERLFGWANSRLRHPALDGLFRGVTELGSVWASLGAGAVLAAGGRRREAADAVGAAGAMWAVGQGLKAVVSFPKWIAKAE